MSRVLLVNMPFAGLRAPALGPSLLKAGLAVRGISCDVAYFNFDFAERIGPDRYAWIADCFAFVLGGERLFGKHYFPGRVPGDSSYFHNVLRVADPGLSDEDLADFAEIEPHVAPFLDRCLESVPWSRYAVVGFTATFQQTLASLCLARRVKRLHPNVVVVFGGAACHGPMGRALVRHFPEVDYAFLGEADRTFSDLVEQIFAGSPLPLPPGVAGQAQPASASPCAAGELLPDAAPLLVERLDELPYPDFDDYFARLARSTLAAQIDPLLLFETSRGCWWGQKHHCAFCGLNGTALAYRSKSPQRTLDELAHLVARHRVHRACAADNIFDHRYFTTLLPMLRQADLGLSFAFELKTNLARHQIAALVESGLAAAQLGIETFVTPILKRVDKGATALQNLQTLKWFSEAGIEVSWNLLYGFPGEDPEDYAPFARLIPSLVHLAPPAAVARVRLDRFSPYFNRPEDYGIARVRPSRAVEHAFALPPESLAELTCYFDFDHPAGDPLDYARPVVDAAATWREIHHAAALRYYDRPDGVLLVHDTRPTAAQFQRRISGWQRTVYLDCDTGRSLPRIVRLAQSFRAPGDPQLDPASVIAQLDEWTAERIMAHVDGCYLSLALRAPS